MKYTVAILLLTVITISCPAQEICNNAIDDDNNGLVDLKDPACTCKDSLPSLNYLLNPSFEDYLECPQWPNQGLGLNHFPYWSTAPFAGDVSYLNSACTWTSWYGCPPAYPIPDGNGFIMIQNIGDIQKGTKNYAATCPVNTLRAGQQYVFECFIGGSTVVDCSNNFFSPVNIVLFGNPDCNADRFTDYISEGCPMNPHPEKPFRDWEQLGAATVYTKNNWKKVHIEFTPTKDMKLLLVGPDCINFGVGTDQYFYADNFSLSEKENFAFKTVTVNNDCIHGIELKAPPAVNASYQWYKDSIAIIGATNTSYNVSRSDTKGNYTVRLVFAHNCLVSTTVSIDPDVFKGLTLGNDTTLCTGESLRLQATIPNLQYLWPDGSNSPQFTVKTAGDYILKATDAFGCSADTKIKVSFKSCTDCPVNVPSAFTPNSDGKNDFFKVFTDCSLIEGFSLGIYNRWGQKVFETKDITKGWNGMQNGKLSPIDVYVYQLQYKRYGTVKAQQEWGTVTLIR